MDLPPLASSENANFEKVRMHLSRHGHSLPKKKKLVQIGPEMVKRKRADRKTVMWPKYSEKCKFQKSEKIASRGGHSLAMKKSLLKSVHKWSNASLQQTDRYTDTQIHRQIHRKTNRFGSPLSKP